jgi:hypothetical protein
MSDDFEEDAGWPEGDEATLSAAPPGWQTPPAGAYGLENAVRCPACKAEIDQIFVVRLIRTRVNFMSSLPRSGRVLACPKCRSILPGELGAVF